MKSSTSRGPVRAAAAVLAAAFALLFAAGCESADSYSISIERGALNVLVAR